MLAWANLTTFFLTLTVAVYVLCYGGLFYICSGAETLKNVLITFYNYFYCFYAMCTLFIINLAFCTSVVSGDQT